MEKRMADKLVEHGVSIDRLRELFRYDPDTGKVYNLVTRGCNHRRALAGSESGCSHPAGYLQTRFANRLWKTHRIAFALHHGRWPNGLVDHANGDNSDNRACNLREADFMQNAQNQKLSARNRSGFKGVSWAGHIKKWQAHIKLGYKSRYLGVFDNAEDASAAYQRAALEQFGAFARNT